jgi:N-glycosylase/DNA lyase
MSEIEKLKALYSSIKKDIEKRLEEFRQLWIHGSDEKIFAELCFCLLTPQSKAKNCWAAVEKLMESRLLFDGNAEKIGKNLQGVRFHNNKSLYIVQARDNFSSAGKILIKDTISGFDTSAECRKWLVKNITGMGYKEASHFLRNIGKGDLFAILDRHILRNLQAFSVISPAVKSLSPKKYLEIENKFVSFSEKINIPVSHLDLLLWYKETGEIFK